LFLTLGLVLWLIRALDWAAVARSLMQADPSWLALAVGSVGLTIIARTLRWRVLLRPRSPPFRSVLTALLMGQIVNYAGPGRLGDLARSYMLGLSGGESKAWVLGTVVLEQFWDVLLLLTAFLFVAFLMKLPPWLIQPFHILGALAALGWLALLAIVWQRRRILALLDHPTLSGLVGCRIRGVVESLLGGLCGLVNPELMAWAGVWSLVVWGLGALTNWTVLRAFHLSLPLTVPVLLLVILQAGIAIPSVPARVGLFEGLCMAGLALFHVEPSIAFSYGLALHVVVFLPPIGLGLGLFWSVARTGMTKPQGAGSPREGV